MKRLLTGLLALIGSIIISSLMYTIGTLYSLGYSIWLSISFKDWKAFFKFWVRLIDGYLHAVGELFYFIGYVLDLGWNVNGEIIEDLITDKEDTTFSQKGITVSASIGKLESTGDLNAFGRGLSKLLNIAFWQKHHAYGAWEYYKFNKEIKAKLFAKLR